MLSSKSGLGAWALPNPHLQQTRPESVRPPARTFHWNGGREWGTLRPDAPCARLSPAMPRNGGPGHFFGV